MIVRSSSNVNEVSGGVVTVIWSSPVVVSEAGTYYVAVRPPEGAPGRKGMGMARALVPQRSARRQGASWPPARTET
jgi:hypothetical protein